MLLPKNAADKLDGENDKLEHTRRTSNYTRSPCPNYQKKMAFFGHACIHNICNIGIMPEESRRGAQGCYTLVTSRRGQGHPSKKT